MITKKNKIHRMKKSDMHTKSLDIFTISTEHNPVTAIN